MMPFKQSKRYLQCPQFLQSVIQVLLVNRLFQAIFYVFKICTYLFNVLPYSYSVFVAWKHSMFVHLSNHQCFSFLLQSFGEIVQSGWMGSMEYKTLERLWAQSKDAWQALLNELPDDSESDRVVVAVGHPAIHLALICRCLDLPMEYMSSFHLDDGSISVIDFPDGTKGRGVVRCTNYTAHLGRWSIPITRPTENDEEF